MSMTWRSSPKATRRVSAYVMLGYLPEKVDKYRTTRGDMTLKELNQNCKKFVPKLCTEPYRHLDDTWVKYHYDTPLADELYKLEQQSSRKLKGRGAGLTRADINALADK